MGAGIRHGKQLVHALKDRPLLAFSVAKSHACAQARDVETSFALMVNNGNSTSSGDKLCTDGQ